MVTYRINITTAIKWALLCSFDWHMLILKVKVKVE